MRREGCHLYICKEIHINCNILPSQRLKSDDSYVVCHCDTTKKTLTATVWRERASSLNKLNIFHHLLVMSSINIDVNQSILVQL